MSGNEKRDLWFSRMTAFEKSSQGVTEWCRENGVQIKSFYYWRRRLRDPELIRQEPGWLTVEPARIAAAHFHSSSEFSGVSVRLGSAIIEVSPDFNESVLGSVVRVLGAVQC